MKDEITLDSLIKKYEEEINKIEKIQFWASPENEMIAKRKKEAYEETLQDLKALKSNQSNLIFGICQDCIHSEKLKQCLIGKD